MARKIEKIRTDFNDVVEEMSKLNLSPNLVIVNQNDSSRRETSSFVLKSDIIGRECDKKEIINLLKQSSANQNVSLVVIVGIGGVGKTTLAQLVYNDGEVKKLFEKSMCRGVPLAIRSLGDILQSKSEEREWVDVLQGDFWKLCEDKDNIFPVLKLSYQNLSLQQRQCFAYCALYPKDSIIDKDELIQMWMAQGYLECSVEDQCMEDVGNQFVNIFVMKSFFQDAKMIQDDDINYLKMHDLMHDLATQVAGVNCCYLNSKAKRCLGRPNHISVELGAFWLLEYYSVKDTKPEFVFSLFTFH